MKIGILGGGQLGRMLALAGYPLGMQTRLLDRHADCSAGQVAPVSVGDYSDESALAKFAEGLDLVTYEFENVPVEAARFLSKRLPVFPPPEILEISQDRLTEKNFFKELGVPVPPFFSVETEDELENAIEHIGLPAVLKTRRDGYDGKGQFVIHEREETEAAWKSLGGRPLILESYIPFDREVSLVAVRARGGETAFYPLVENEHRQGILHQTLAPAPELTPELQHQAESCAEKIFAAMKDAEGYAGVLTIEFFEVDGHLLANEMATRVHNSGHWSIEGAESSQFENHLRAIAGLPLGSTRTRCSVGMLNIIGTLPDIREILAVPATHLHLYGKTPVPGRKVGHVTICAPNDNEREHLLKWLRPLIINQLSAGKA